MRYKDLIYFLIVLIGLLAPLAVKGQEYSMELGLLGGESFYMGDANKERLFSNSHGAFGVLARYRLDDRLALKGNVLVAGLSGKTDGSMVEFRNGENSRFDQRIIDASLLLELNFYNYGVPTFRSGSSKWSPYVLIGFGITAYRAEKQKICTNVPFGLGIKAKVSPRINIGGEWTFRRTSVDDLDYTGKTTGFKLEDFEVPTISGNKNKDWYSILMLYVSYDLHGIGAKCFR